MKRITQAEVKQEGRQIWSLEVAEKIYGSSRVKSFYDQMAEKGNVIVVESGGEESKELYRGLYASGVSLHVCNTTKT